MLYLWKILFVSLQICFGDKKVDLLITDPKRVTSSKQQLLAR